jgi:hypothetical protein
VRPVTATKIFFVTHVWKLLVALAFCAMLVLAVQFLRIARYEYIEQPGGQYVLRVDRLRGRRCWIALYPETGEELRLRVTIAECR